jgi:hypothetical protein
VRPAGVVAYSEPCVVYKYRIDRLFLVGQSKEMDPMQLLSCSLLLRMCKVRRFRLCRGIRLCLVARFLSLDVGEKQLRKPLSPSEGLIRAIMTRKGVGPDQNMMRRIGPESCFAHPHEMFLPLSRSRRCVCIILSAFCSTKLHSRHPRSVLA